MFINTQKRLESWYSGRRGMETIWRHEKLYS